MYRIMQLDKFGRIMDGNFVIYHTIFEEAIADCEWFKKNDKEEFNEETHWGIFEDLEKVWEN